MKYSGTLNWQDSDGQTGTVGTFKDIEAENKAIARLIVMDECWDHRLDSASCIPVIIFDE